jgi:hypothetical protein
MYHHAIILIVSSLILSACAGGLSGIMTSSVPGQWLIYQVTYPESAKRFEPSPEGRWDHLIYYEGIIEKLLIVDLGYKKKQDWHSPLLANAQVATFKQKYRGNYINLDVEISLERILIMSTSYSSDTKKAFDNLQSALKEIFSETNVEECFDTKTLYGHDCFGNI